MPSRGFSVILVISRLFPADYDVEDRGLSTKIYPDPLCLLEKERNVEEGDKDLLRESCARLVKNRLCRYKLPFQTYSIQSVNIRSLNNFKRKIRIFETT